MNLLIESMQSPIDNLLGLFMYALLFTVIPGVVISLILMLIPRHLPYFIRNIAVGISVYFGIFMWWNMIVN